MSPVRNFLYPLPATQKKLPVRGLHVFTVPVTKFVTYLFSVIIKNLIYSSLRAFSAVVADNQFASLSLVLMALVARISHVIRASGNYALDKSNVVQPKEAVPLGEDRSEVVSGAMYVEVSTSSTKGSRAMNHRRMSENRNPEQAVEFKDTGRPGEVAKPRKRRRKRNAIDNIFNALL